MAIAWGRGDDRGGNVGTPIAMPVFLALLLLLRWLLCFVGLISSLGLMEHNSAQCPIDGGSNPNICYCCCSFLFVIVFIYDYVFGCYWCCFRCRSIHSAVVVVAVDF